MTTRNASADRPDRAHSRPAEQLDQAEDPQHGDDRAEHRPAPEPTRPSRPPRPPYSSAMSALSVEHRPAVPRLPDQVGQPQQPARAARRATGTACAAAGGRRGPAATPTSTPRSRNTTACLLLSPMPATQAGQQPSRGRSSTSACATTSRTAVQASVSNVAVHSRWPSARERGGGDRHRGERPGRLGPAEQPREAPRTAPPARTTASRLGSRSTTRLCGASAVGEPGEQRGERRLVGVAPGEPLPGRGEVQLVAVRAVARCHGQQHGSLDRHHHGRRPPGDGWPVAPSSIAGRPLVGHARSFSRSGRWCRRSVRARRADSPRGRRTPTSPRRTRSAGSRRRRPSPARRPRPCPTEVLLDEPEVLLPGPRREVVGEEVVVEDRVVSHARDVEQQRRGPAGSVLARRAVEQVPAVGLRDPGEAARRTRPGRPRGRRSCGRRRASPRSRPAGSRCCSPRPSGCP